MRPRKPTVGATRRHRRHGWLRQISILLLGGLFPACVADAPAAGPPQGAYDTGSGEPDKTGDGAAAEQLDVGEPGADADRQADAGQADTGPSDATDPDRIASIPQVACKSDKACIQYDLVCAKVLGQCVNCVGDEDCPGTQVCRAFHCIHPPKPCKSSKQCYDLGKVCDLSEGICLDCIGDVDCAKTQHCTDGLCLADVCTAAERKCQSDTTVWSCAPNGSHWAQQLCPQATVCHEGACTKQVCLPGATKCDGNNATACDPKGLAWTTSEVCGSSKICKGGTCIAHVCKPGAQLCANAVAKKCNADGQGWTEQPCKSGPVGQAEVCVVVGGVAMCKSQQCVPGAKSCSGTKVMQCSGTGLAESFVKNCASATPALGCSAGACVAKVCVPGAKKCAPDGAGVVVCADDGSAFSMALTCSTKEVCEAGKCMAKICTPEAIFCTGKVIYKCSSTGASKVKLWQCPSSKLCHKGACTSKVCDVGQVKCDGNVRKECIDGGAQWLNTACPAGTKCTAGVCKKPDG